MIWWIIAGVCTSFLWIAWEYSKAVHMDEPSKYNWDDNTNHTEQGF